MSVLLKRGRLPISEIARGVECFTAHGVSNSVLESHEYEIYTIFPAQRLRKEQSYEENDSGFTSAW